MKTVDLHVHSTASDGTFSPSLLVETAKKINLSAMALTDHDTIDGIPEAMQVARDLDIELIPGIELSSAYLNKEIHIVGLFVDYKDEAFISALDELKKTRDGRNEEMIRKCQENGFDITLDDLISEYPDAVITRAHFAAYFTKMKYTSSNKDAFDRYFNDHGKLYVPRYKIPAKDTIELIHSAGGVAILAHPILYRLGNEELEKLVKYLVRCGLDGIEALYSTYSRSDEILIRKLAKENHLALSGGSDFHGANKPSIHLGCGKGNLAIPYEVLDNLRNLKP